MSAKNGYAKYYLKYDIVNPRHQKFVEEFMVDGNQTRAYKAAYPNSRNEVAIRASASNLLKTHQNVKACIEELRGELQKKSMADTVELRERLTAILRGETESEAVVVVGVGKGCSEAIKVAVKPSHGDIIRAADKLLKALGAYDTKTTEGIQGMTINIAAIDDSQKAVIESLKARRAAVKLENQQLELEFGGVS